MGLTSRFMNLPVVYVRINDRLSVLWLQINVHQKRLRRY